MSWSDLRKGRYSLAECEYFITFNTLDRQPFFKDFDLACLFSQQISVNETKHHCTWLTWVLMPDHFHGLVRLGLKDSNLSKLVGALKGASSFKINKHRGCSGNVLQPSFYDRALRAEDDRKNMARYIVANPLRKGLVRHIKYYPFWNSVYL
ncbi:transposase [Paraglaciecola sp.]|uniref:REP-associated tyrosine transposase n=1 Tax=Paraglaciecola sp. TaxID=1920173 RepID=UPI00326592A9